MENSVRNIQSALDAIGEFWQPHRLTSINDYDVKVVKLEGEFVWHAHPETDELFWVISGRLTIQQRDRDVELGPGDVYVVPKGVEHCPKTEGEVSRRAHRAERHREHGRRRRRPDSDAARTTLGSVSTLSELLLAEGRSTDDVEWLHLLVADGQLLADLAFADIVLWVPTADGSFVAVAHSRPSSPPPPSSTATSSASRSSRSGARR